MDPRPSLLLSRAWHRLITAARASLLFFLALVRGLAQGPISEPLQVAGHILHQVEPDDPPINIQQRLAATERLGRLEHPEGERGLIRLVRVGMPRRWSALYLCSLALDYAMIPAVYLL